MMLFKTFKFAITLLALLMLATFVEAATATQKSDNKLTVKELKKNKVQPEIVEKSQRALWFAHALRDKEENRGLKNLELKFKKLPVFLVPTADSLRPLIQLRVLYNLKDWSLFDGEKFPLTKVSDGDDDEEKEYVVYAFLNSRVSTVQLYALGPEDELREEKIYIFAPEAREFKTSSVFDSVVFSTGYSYLAYTQSSFGTFVADSVFLGLNYESPDKGGKWGIYTDLNATVVTLESSPVREPSNYLEAYAGGSYKPEFMQRLKMRSKLRFGLTNANFFTFGRDFGFTGLVGPSFGLKSDYFINGTSSFSVDLMVSVYDFTDFTKERGFKLGGSYQINLKNLRKAQFSIEYSNTEFTSNFENIVVDFLAFKAGLSF